jgi:6,7-dimethyl-8-ribityllumazine synthase
MLSPTIALLCSAGLASAFVLNAPHAPLNRRAAEAASSSVRMAAGNEAIDFPELDGTNVRIGIIKARWHEGIINDLASGAEEALAECGVQKENIVISEVPGSFELPLAARYLALSGTVDAILPIACLIKGDTYHFEVIADTVTRGLMDVSLSTGIPVMFGVLTVNTEEQAIARATGSNNHGIQWGKGAVEMALLRSSALGGQGKKLFMGFGDSPAEEDKSKPMPVGAPKKIGF